jgi:hypothetical protein
VADLADDDMVPGADLVFLDFHQALPRHLPEGRTPLPSRGQAIRATSAAADARFSPWA